MTSDAQSKKTTGNLFIAQILTHNGLRRDVGVSADDLEQLLEPGFAAVFAVCVAESGFQNLSFAVSANRLHDDDHWNQYPQDWAVNH
jgi:hypothetical protein